MVTKPGYQLCFALGGTGALAHLYLAHVASFGATAGLY